MRNQCLVGGRRRCPGNSRLAASSQSLPDADQCFSSRQRICSECTDLDVDCASGRLNPAELGSAATLGGLQFNISWRIGPVLGGFLVTFIGANFVFLANGACFVFMSLSILQWKQPEAISKDSS